MAQPGPRPTGPIPIAPGTNPPAPPGMMAVPVAILTGHQRHAAQQAGNNMGVMGGMMAGMSGGGGNMGADMVMGSVMGNYMGQQVDHHREKMIIEMAMNDPYAPKVFVDENSRAARRVKRWQRRQARRSQGGWLGILFGGRKGGVDRDGPSEPGPADGEPATQN